MRHFVERGTLDTDGIRHSAKLAWRAMALLQKEIEGEQPDKRAEPDDDIRARYQTSLQEQVYQDHLTIGDRRFYEGIS